MDEAENEDREATTKRLAQVICKLRQPGLSLPELDALQIEKETLLAKVMKTAGVPAPTEAESRARITAQERFLERLITRQGTVTFDFHSLYEKRAELDRNLSPYKHP